ncbi:type III secretion system chaperone [Paraliomyxa miuraensis]|uniref:type III secretion system chaperone n=1 Tax=Paraliomyxa miuraensis TaxID=376150 RepID=UPI00225A4B80|nr:type III secretion system chaperone [Paraliomyxa miuraensis]MCX4242172.1 type III secretion system chaperone [Paraliomyxa miuraensis]
MTPEDLERVLREAADEIEGEDGRWQLRLDDVALACMVDVHYDRMRLIAPIAELDEVSDDVRDACLEANFHTTLDARYATSDGVLYAAFIHPLSSLDAELAESALQQVANLVETFGTTFSSGALVFGLPPRGHGGAVN